MAESILIVGASRGVGLGLAAESVRRGWDVVATVRDAKGAERLGRLAPGPGRLQIETLDITNEADCIAMRERLRSRRFETLLIVAGVVTPTDEEIASTPLEEFLSVMATNSYWPIRFVEAFKDLVSPQGSIGLVSSRGGSIAMNQRGDRQSYRASKAALNMMTMSARRKWGDARTVFLLHPGWVRTDMGGPDGEIDVETSATGMLDAIASRKGSQGVVYVDYKNELVPW